MAGSAGERFFGFYRIAHERLSTPKDDQPHKLSVRRAIRHSAGVDWWLHMVATSGRYNDGLWEIEHRWSVRQLVAAHRVIDVWIEIDKANAPQPQKT